MGSRSDPIAEWQLFFSGQNLKPFILRFNLLTGFLIDIRFLLFRHSVLIGKGVGVPTTVLNGALIRSRLDIGPVT